MYRRIKLKGILDRFENDSAVILIEEEKEELIVPKRDLPKGSKVNTYFVIEKNFNGYEIVGIDEEKTILEREKSSSLMDRLKAKRKTSKFKKK
jgi:hypothetical protein